MQRQLSDFRNILIGAIGIQLLGLVILYFLFHVDVWIGGILLVVEAVLLYLTYDRIVRISLENEKDIEEIVQGSYRDAYLFGEVGLVTYDNEHIIRWMSKLFAERGIDQKDTKLLEWVPEAGELIDGSSDEVKVQLDEKIYLVTKKEDERVLFFKDITDLNSYRTAYEEGMPVVGMASLDNYEESTQYEDEATVSSINVAVRTPFTDYCREHGILVKRINNYRYLMFLNERIFNNLVFDHFSVLSTVRKAAQKQDVTITLSMAFARGTENYEELDEMVAKLLDLAQSRGGDQVAIQVAGEEVKHFGGSSEAQEKRSRVRVRVMAHTLRELINRSSNVIIVGHKEADFDCIGSALGMAEAAKALKKPVSIISKTGGIEEKLNRIMTKQKQELSELVSFVTENEAYNQLQEDTLVVMVDHNNLKQSNGAKVLEQAQNIAIIDHHRRGSDIGIQPILVYIEAGVSSASELVTELLPYISNRVEVSELEANILLAGMTIDTNRFTVRTGTRTYEAASTLRRWGADPLIVDEYLKDSYDQFALKTAVLNQSERLHHGILLSTVTDRSLTRSMMSQVADSLLDIQDVEASFVLANNTDGETAISARSNGKINVQVIMEQMNGGGHMTAAAMQRPKTDISEVRNELLDTIEEYFKEVQQDESDIDE